MFYLFLIQIYLTALEKSHFHSNKIQYSIDPVPSFPSLKSLAIPITYYLGSNFFVIVNQPSSSQEIVSIKITLGTQHSNYLLGLFQDFTLKNDIFCALVLDKKYILQM